MSSYIEPASDELTSGSRHWQRNLAVCVAGSFSTIVAMTLLLPYLPLYVEQLGVRGHSAIVQWSGIAYSATFFSAALTAPLWGSLADRFGRKPLLIRASLGMAVTMSLIGLAHNIWQLVGLRLLAGLLGGYSSGSTILVATQTPKARSGWALGLLAAGVMAGNVAGPLIGGVAPSLIGIRRTFFFAGGLIFLAFLATCFLLKEDRPVARAPKTQPGRTRIWAQLPDRRPVIVLLVTAGLLTLATISIEPILTLYVQELSGRTADLTTISGLIFAAAAVGSIVSAPLVGRQADRIGHINVVIGCLLGAAVLLVAQAAVTDVIELGVLRLLMGLCLGGLMPCVTAAIRHRVPDLVVGRVLGYGVSAQFAGQVIGPTLGGFVGGRIGLRAVFIATAAILVAGAALNYSTLRDTR